MMDPHLKGFCGSRNEIQLENQSLPVFQNQRYENVFFYQSREFGLVESNLITDTPSLTTSISTHEEPYPEDCEFSDAVLSYINKILMEEDMEDKTCMLQDSLDLQIAEKSFYEVIGEKYPVSPLGKSSSLSYQNDGVGDNNFIDNYYGSCVDDGDLSSIFNNNYLRGNSMEVQFPHQDFIFNSISQSSYSSTNSVKSTVEGPLDSPDSILQITDGNSENQPILQFQKGVEEANKFLPSGKGFFPNLDVAKYSILEPKVMKDELSVKVEKDDQKSFLYGSKGRKHPHGEEGDIEENRSNKQAAIYSEPTLRSTMFDIILLHSLGDGRNYFMARREALQTKIKMINLPSSKSKKATSCGKGRGKKQHGKTEVVDLRTLLVLCAQAVAADDHKSAHELLKQIRQHSSPFGDGNQRLAHMFADGLEARLAGTGSQIYKGLISKRTSAADLLKAYHLYLTACPFRKMTSFVSNISIMRSAASSMRVHVVDFGILYGFQWPTFIQRLSIRPGGPPKLRITGIDFPQPGFRPAERIKETGSRLAAYAESFNVPFEYNAIAKKWETIQLEELKIDRDEYLVVTCFYRGKNLLDESVVVDSPRNKFLSLIRKIKPDIFIHGIINGAFNAPFFVTRFREALFHFSSLFDMLECIVPREDWERMLIEKEIFGKEALNVIACEGCERVERPETYRQWQVRILRAGFSQRAFDKNTVERALEIVRSRYHKDFVMDEDRKWLLQGWKGRIVYALSCWKPA
ncbi:scarecrow-like protein 9 [Cicer arietinum]|uniref:Scarecrow-like protein 9 n=1 Tax=Cicer arietinum TaxID=3827 RepID=A0A1S2XP47_CICAR|nr:scarecrow-like protein 9 [Cicer arietinum]